jgi:DNA polymerase V
MQMAITGFAARAGEKLRQEKSSTVVRSVSLSEPARFHPGMRPVPAGATETLLVATQDSRDIIAAAQRALARIWRDGYRYAKAGIMLADFSGREAQLNLFDECAPRPDSEALMNAVDRINRAGKGRIFFFAGQGDQCGVRDAQGNAESGIHDRLERLAACFHEISDIWIL